MPRQLATIQTVEKIRPIPNADKIVVAEVLGWEVVIRKDEFKIGDKVVYIEVDSIVDPTNPYFAFMQERKYRVRAIKLRKQISMGLCCPISILPTKNYKIGDDVTDILKITKYDPEGDRERALQEQQDGVKRSRINKFLYRSSLYRRIFGKKKEYKGFPKFIKKTDEERIQNMPWVCRDQDTQFFVTEKLDGQSASYFLLHNKKKWYQRKATFTFGVCSRNVYLRKKDSSNYWKIAEKYNIEATLYNLIGDSEFIVLQGEICGTGVQCAQVNPYKLTGLEFYAFNLVFDGRRVNHNSMVELLSPLSILTVPLLYNTYTLNTDVHEVVRDSIGTSKLLANIQREGFVIRNYEKNISFKVLNPEYLLQENS